MWKDEILNGIGSLAHLAVFGGDMVFPSNVVAESIKDRTVTVEEIVDKFTSELDIALGRYNK